MAWKRRASLIASLPHFVHPLLGQSWCLQSYLHCGYRLCAVSRRLVSSTSRESFVVQWHSVSVCMFHVHSQEIKRGHEYMSGKHNTQRTKQGFARRNYTWSKRSAVQDGQELIWTTRGSVTCAEVHTKSSIMNGSHMSNIGAFRVCLDCAITGLYFCNPAMR